MVLPASPLCSCVVMAITPGTTAVGQRRTGVPTPQVCAAIARVTCRFGVCTRTARYALCRERYMQIPITSGTVCAVGDCELSAADAPAAGAGRRPPAPPPAGAPARRSAPRPPPRHPPARHPSSPRPRTPPPPPPSAPRIGHVKDYGVGRHLFDLQSPVSFTSW